MIDEKGNFKVFIPAELVKAKSKSGKSKMILRGIASTAVQDSQGETLDPNGFDLSYLKKHGYINWDHQAKKDPKALIGRPTANTKIEKGQMLIEAELFEENQRAKDAYEMQQILEKAGLALGWSIEGKATERGAKKQGEPGWEIVKKARITGVALTPNPINQDTVAEIVKSHSFDLPLEKSNSAYEDTSDEEQEKAMSTETGRALMPESVDKKVKNTLSKGEVYRKLFEDMPLLGMDSADRIYELTANIEKSINPDIMETPETDGIHVSEEALEKAYKTLGLSKSEATEEEASTENSDATTDDVTKSEGDDLQNEVIDASKNILEKAGYKVELVKSETEESEEDTSEEDEGDDVEKSEVVNLLKSELGKLRTENKEQSQAVGTLIKGFQGEIEELRGKVEIMAKESPGVRAITTTAFLEKSEASITDDKNAAKTISLSRNKAQVMEIVDNACGLAKGEITDSLLADSLCQYESSSYADDRLVKSLSEAGYNVIA